VTGPWTGPRFSGGLKPCRVSPWSRATAESRTPISTPPLVLANVPFVPSDGRRRSVRRRSAFRPLRRPRLAHSRSAPCRHLAIAEEHRRSAICAWCRIDGHGSVREVVMSTVHPTWVRGCNASERWSGRQPVELPSGGEDAGNRQARQEVVHPFHADLSRADIAHGRNDRHHDPAIGAVSLSRSPTGARSLSIRLSRIIAQAPACWI
jgi:hypothetical protein